MKKFLMISIAAAISIITFSSYENDLATKGLNLTGANGSSTTCSGSTCHGNSTGANLVLSIIVTDNMGNVVNGSYIPGVTYRITVKGQLASGGSPMSVFGLQFTTGKSNDGSFTLIGNTLKSIVIPPYEYIEHNGPIPATSGNTYSTYFFWKAPPAGAGIITFYCTMLAANGDHTINGDVDDNASLSLIEGSTSVADLSKEGTIKIYPNPVEDRLNISFDMKSSGDYTVSIYDLSGRKITQKDLSGKSGIFETTVNSSNWTSGMYIVDIAKDGAHKKANIIRK